ncbi:SusC/RagA family TonB-linked outer membrane protein [Niabella beijingensis]|uniref:SusC/RagA family TonB-linked outer membrane protein n=1 Tax=Niabella beijingensis TaxID=2872700 RepID=UPI001CBAC522|nr:SusC/RagA family TonB-linked outer membrane protein [Niabella beijingensis]MBZ4192482.1 SusC/RagA family TonB-linked outer membrane protein [Niabella beijingensis]
MKKNDCPAVGGLGSLCVKFFLIMNGAVLLILFSSLQVFALEGRSQQKIDLDLKGKTIVSVIKYIENRYQYRFFYNDNDELNSRKVDIYASKASIDDVMDNLLKNSSLSYKKMNSGMVVIVGYPSETVSLNVKGVVTDEAGAPLSGVNIVEKGTTNGTTTDENGSFSIKVADSNAILIISIVGYLSREIPVNNGEAKQITLQKEENRLDEVVVVGYGTQRKKDLTGSVAQVSNKDLQAVPVYNVGEALQGRASGVSVAHNSGAPGSRVQVRVRGGNSMIGSNDPLYVVDGFPIAGGINFLNPADIESIDILKDASATAIYGARGANGVVMVTTKRGKGGARNEIAVNSYYGVQQTAKRFDMLDARQYATVVNEFLKNDGKAPYFNLDDIQGPGTDWQDAIFRDAPVQNHTLSFSGMNERTNYSMSGNYYEQQGIIINSGAKKGSFRLNLDHEIKDWLKVAVNLNLSRRQQYTVPVDNGRRGNNMFSGALSAPPTSPIYDNNGLPVRIGEAYPFTDPGDMRNPMLWAAPYKNQTLANTVLLNNAFTFKLTKELSFVSRIGLEYENSISDGFTPIIYPNDRGSASNSSTYWNSVLNEEVLTYEKAFTGGHKLTATGGFTYQTYMTRNSGISVSGFPNNNTENYNLGSAETINPPTSGISRWSLVSGLGRVNYSFLDRYFVTGSIRADGSSRFGKDNKWGIFPSGALAWRLSEERFIRDNLTFINNLKLRASYGITGNTALSPYQSLDRLSPVKYIYNGNTENVGYAPSGIANSQLKWETSSELDLGLDLAILTNRLGFTFDYYKKNTKDLLASVPLPPSAGFGYMLRNVGEIQNQGLEFSVNADVLTGAFKWNAAAQLSTNRNKVLKIAGESDIVTAGQTSGLPGYNLARVGQPLGVFYGYLEDGLDENGFIKFVDVNKDGSITPLDRVILGNPYPKFEYGFNSSFSYKDVSLTVFLQGVKGNDIFFATAFTNLNSFQRTQNQFADLFGNYWTADNPDPHAKYPKLSSLTQMRPSDRFIEDGSYLRVKSVQLSYSLPVKKMKLDWLSYASIYVKATNLFTFTKYPGLDPEVNTRGSDSQSIEDRLFIGTDESGYPNARVFGAGIELRF